MGPLPSRWPLSPWRSRRLLTTTTASTVSSPSARRPTLLSRGRSAPMSTRGKMLSLTARPPRSPMTRSLRPRRSPLVESRPLPTATLPTPTMVSTRSAMRSTRPRPTRFPLSLPLSLSSAALPTLLPRRSVSPRTSPSLRSSARTRLRTSASTLPSSLMPPTPLTRRRSSSGSPAASRSPSPLTLRPAGSSTTNSLILIVDDERSQLLDTSPVPQLPLTSPHTPGGVHLGHIGPGLVLPQEHHGLLGLGEGLDLVSHDQRDLRDALDLMTLGHDQSRDTSGSDGRADGVPLLGGVDLPVPPPPGFGGGEHVTSTAHVSVSSLARSLGTTTLHPGDTSHGTPSSPM